MSASKDDKDDLEARVVRYALKYGHGETAKTKGLEAYAVHLFALEDGLDAVLGGEDTWEARLDDYILPTDDLGVDGVLNRRVREADRPYSMHLANILGQAGVEAERVHWSGR